MKTSVRGALGPSGMVTARGRLAPTGGVYICEDIHKRSNPFLSYIDGLSRNLHTARYVSPAHSSTLKCAPSSFQQHVDSIHIYPFIVVIEMRRNTISELSAPMKGTQWQPFLHIDLPHER